ncbi:hypothetical protein SOPP22_03585 [Shewanella sp. OPT22]|nr:hypothetical protein SOPP22_03585 [Shewanella sp. OPT22]
MRNLAKLSTLFALSCTTGSAIASFNFNIETSTPASGHPFQIYTVNVDSEHTLKLVEVDTLPAEWCSTPFYTYKPETVSGNSYSKTISYNYKNHKNFNGNVICVYAEDEEGNQQTYSLPQPLTLTPPEINVEEVSSPAFKLEYNEDDSQYLKNHKINFFYRQQHAGKTQNFAFSGTTTAGTDIAITDYQGHIIALADMEENGEWLLKDFPVTLKTSSVTSETSFFLNSLLHDDHDVVLHQQKLSIKGKKVAIEILKRPEVPLDKANYDSGKLSWDIQTPLNITSTRFLMLDDPQRCSNVDAQPNIIHELDGRTHFNFMSKPELHGFFACMQIEDDKGNLFNEPVGWIKQQPKPEIFIDDSVSESKVTSDFINGYALEAETVFINYLSDNGIQNRDYVWSQCQQRSTGTPLNGTEINLVLSDPTLNDRYLCITADNGLGGISHWLSEHKLNLENGLEITENSQLRKASTPYPTQLSIPAALQNATTVSTGCRGVLLAPDLLMSAGHCLANDFHPTNGKWAHSPKTWTYLVAQDELDHRLYSDAQNKLFAAFRAGELSRTEFQTERLRIRDELSKTESSGYDIYYSPYFGRGVSAKLTFSDYVLLDLDTPYSNSQETINYPQPLVYTYPSDFNLTNGEFRAHGIHENNPNSGWRGAKIHSLMPAGGNTVEYTLVNTAGGESGSALWAYDEDLETYGVIGAVRGGGAWSSVWNHGRVTRQALADSRKNQLVTRRNEYQGQEYSYRDLRRAVAKANIELINTIIDSGVEVTKNNNGIEDGWMLARAVDFAIKARNEMLERNNVKHQQKYQQRLDVIKALMLGGADPRLTISKPTRFMTVETGDSVLHYVIRTNAPKVMQAIWLNVTDYAFESQSRTVKNTLGETPMHIAMQLKTDPIISKLLFTDVRNDIFVKNNAGESVINQLLNIKQISTQQVAIIDTVGKAFSYEPKSIDVNGDFSHDSWKQLACYQPELDGQAMTFAQIANLRSDELTKEAFAAIHRLSHISGIDASQHCQ